MCGGTQNAFCSRDGSVCSSSKKTERRRLPFRGSYALKEEGFIRTLLLLNSDLLKHFEHYLVLFKIMERLSFLLCFLLLLGLEF